MRKNRPTSISLARDVWARFKLRCAERETTVTHQLEKLIEAWLKATAPKNRPPKAA